MLKDGGRTDTGTGRGRQVFVTAQVALCVVLLLAATLFAPFLHRGLTIDLGLEPHGVVVATTDLARLGYDEDRGRDFYAALLERVRALPGVEAAGLSQFTFLRGDSFRSDVTTPDAVPGGPTTLNARFGWVDPGLFETLRMQVTAGRGITAGDGAGAAPVVVVNESLAERLWPGESPLGRRVRVDVDREVVGVVRDGRYAFVPEPPRPFLFLPFGQEYRASMTLHVRAPGAEAATLRAVEAAVRSLDPDVAVQGASTLREGAELALYPYRFAARMAGLFGGLGLLLAAVGLYGILAFQVAQRTRELGVRRVLGARSADIVRLVLRTGGVLAAAGCALGVVLGALASAALGAS